MPARCMIMGLAFSVATGGMAHAQGMRGDLNCDGTVNLFDIDPFVLVLTGAPPNYPEYYAQYPACDHLLADTDCDDTANTFDIDSFVECLAVGCPPCPGVMVLVPAGEFEMGDPWSEGESRERPVHSVYVSSFYMDVYEVTSSRYCAYLNSTNGQGLIHVSSDIVYKVGGTRYPYCDTYSADPDSRIHWDGNVFTVTAGKEDHPMLEVSWYGAVAYSNWRSDQDSREPCYDLGTWQCDFSANGYRLPTEAEWEKAAGWDPAQERHFRFGEHTDGCGYNCLGGHRANYWDSGDPYEGGGYPETTPVGYYDGSDHGGYQTEDAQSYYGCYDMSGNVWEWCHDWYDSGYYDTYPPDGWPSDPTGPASGTHCVLRGGNLDGIPHYCRSAPRYGYTPGFRYDDGGFRCAAGTP